MMTTHKLGAAHAVVLLLLMTRRKASRWYRGYRPRGRLHFLSTLLHSHDAAIALSFAAIVTMDTARLSTVATPDWGLPLSAVRGQQNSYSTFRSRKSSMDRNLRLAGHHLIIYKSVFDTPSPPLQTDLPRQTGTSFHYPIAISIW